MSVCWVNTDRIATTNKNELQKISLSTVLSTYWNKKHLKNVGPIRHCKPPHAHSPDVASGTLVRRLRIDVHDIDNDDNNDNVWQRGPLWPHGIGPINPIKSPDGCRWDTSAINWSCYSQEKTTCLPLILLLSLETEAQRYNANLSDHYYRKLHVSVFHNLEINKTTKNLYNDKPRVLFSQTTLVIGSQIFVTSGQQRWHPSKWFWRWSG